MESLETIKSTLQAKKDLSIEGAKELVSLLLSEDLTDQNKAELLVLLTEKGESPSELESFSCQLLTLAVDPGLSQEAIDLCGTGGSGLERFNVSTACAFLLAGVGIPVVKHGNRGSRKPNGSFDLLDELGLDYNLEPSFRQELFSQTNLAFLFARTHHPAMKAVVGARKIAARRTIFNLAGPLSNPARPKYQIIGTPDRKVGQLILEVLRLQKRERALVVTGHPGIDELSISGESTIWELRDGITTETTVKPEDFGLSTQSEAGLKYGDATQNRDTLMDLLTDKLTGPLRDMVLLNAGAGAYTAGAVTSIQEGILLAEESLVSGKARENMEKYRRLTKSLG